jgi:hypothetical protein
MKENTTYLIKRATVTTTKNASTVLSTITGLVAKVTGGDIYKFVLTVMVTGKHAADVKVALTGPTSSVLTYGLSSVTPKVTAGGTGITVTLADDTLSVIVIQGIIDNTAGADGSLTAQVAQNVSDASNTIVEPGSALEVWQISDSP